MPATRSVATVRPQLQQVQTVNFRTFMFLQQTLSRSSLHQMFKMMSVYSDAYQKSLPPLIDGLINDGLTEVWPHLNQTLFQLINVTYTFLIHPVLKTAPNSVVNSVQVRAVRWSEVGDMNSGVTWQRYLTVACAWWACALSCWKTNRSPAIWRIEGSICCDSRTSLWYVLPSTLTPGSTKMSSVQPSLETAMDTMTA